MRPHVFAAIVVIGLGPLAHPAASAEPQQRARAQARNAMRFQGMDTNADGRITRDEWRGSEQSFRTHDWNGDGVLAGNEVRAGAARNRNEDDFANDRRWEFTDWTVEGFRTLDHNNDRRISRSEWHYDVESFVRADRNRDDMLTRAEFLNSAADTDDDRGDRFDNLDANRNGRIERSEWHGTRDAFEWMDRNNDNVLSRVEVVGEDAPEPDLFSSLDVNRDGRVLPNEWHWSRRSFDQQDRNRDGVLSRYELANMDTPSAPTGVTTVFVIDGRQRWVDTGIDVRPGDTVSLTAEGEIIMSNDNADVAAPAGSRSGRRAAEAPLRDQPAGALIARIGNAAPVLVGASRVLDRNNTGGRLYLGVNDDYLLDNRGQFRVIVTTQRR